MEFIIKSETVDGKVTRNMSTSNVLEVVKQTIEAITSCWKIEINPVK